MWKEETRRWVRPHDGREGDGGSGGSGGNDPRPKAEPAGGVPTGGAAGESRERRERAAEARLVPDRVARVKTIDRARSRRVRRAHAVEREVADAVGGWNLLDSEPADVIHAPAVDAAGELTGEPVRFGSGQDAPARLLP